MHWDPASLTWHLKMLCQSPSESSGFFRAWATRLLAWPCNKSFPSPDTDILICLASLHIEHTNLYECPPLRL